MLYSSRVKFGCALEDTCRAHGDIPGPLLVLVLCINKLGPHKRDVFRAPGHQGGYNSHRQSCPITIMLMAFPVDNDTNTTSRNEL